MSTEMRPAHSPLGASGAERWMNCPGSVALLKDLHLPQSDEDEWRHEGTAAHQVANDCAVNGQDAWEYIGQKIAADGKEIEVTQEMADAVQVFLDECRAHVTPISKVYTEFSIAAPKFHELFYGTLDRGIVTDKLMVIRDFKYGAGIMVEADHNPQIMYYAYGLLRHHPEVTDVSIGIVQPRGYHPEGPIRVAPLMPADEIREWAETVLKPAMMRTAVDNDLDAGPWCRFCPAKLVCPLMQSLFGAAMQTDPKMLYQRTDETADRDWKYIKALDFFLKAMKDDAYARLQRGVVLKNCKLVPKKADRVFKEGADKLAQEKFGEEVFTKPEMKTPAQVEKISAEAKKFVHEYAYTPQTGLTVADISDKRPAVKVQTATEAFPHAAALAAEAASE